MFKADTDEPSEEDMDNVVNLLRKRLDFQGYTEASVTMQGSNKVRVELSWMFRDSDKAVETRSNGSA